MNNAYIGHIISAYVVMKPFASIGDTEHVR